MATARDTARPPYPVFVSALGSLKRVELDGGLAKTPSSQNMSMYTRSSPSGMQLPRSAEFPERYRFLTLAATTSRMDVFVSPSASLLRHGQGASSPGHEGLLRPSGL